MLTISRIEKLVFCKLFPENKLRFIAVGNNEGDNFIGEVFLFDEPDKVIAVCDENGLRLVNFPFDQERKNTTLANTLAKYLTPLAVLRKTRQRREMRKREELERCHKEFEEFMNRSKTQ